MGGHNLDNLGQLPGQTRGDEIGLLSRNLADLLARNQQFLQRERAFSRHCSHELRTPIAIIKNSVSLLKRPSCSDQLRQRSIVRIDSATVEMTRLVETFLLLGRSDEVMTSQELDLNTMITKILKHLRQTLPLELTMQSLTVSGHGWLRSEPILCNVLLTNIIRNAFVHSVSCINIAFDENSITVTNDVPHGTTSLEQGYGYGLEIMDRIAARLDYDITIGQREISKSESSQIKGSYRVNVSFNLLTN